MADRTPSGERQNSTGNWAEIWMILKTSQNIGWLSPWIWICPVSPPASYNPSFRRRLYIQVNQPPSTLLCSDLCLMVGQYTHLLSNHETELTAPRYTLISEWSDDWPRRRLVKHRGALCSRDCLTGAICKHRETNKTADGNTSMWQYVTHGNNMQ